ncbi:MAG TPA: VOC family protein [Acidimicrobiia bacterium]|nr:VOC family protein [Acidimicrobiia bacterium]
MKVTRIHHASVSTAGRHEDAQRFYTDVLGLPLAPRPDLGVDGSWLQAGPKSQVHLIDAEPAGTGIDPIGHHYCLAVDDLDAAVADLEEAGVEYFRIGEGAGAQVFVTDPAGNTIEFQQDG